MVLRNQIVAQNLGLNISYTASGVLKSSVNKAYFFAKRNLHQGNNDPDTLRVADSAYAAGVINGITLTDTPNGLKVTVTVAPEDFQLLQLGEAAIDVWFEMVLSRSTPISLEKGRFTLIRTAADPAV